MPSKRELLRLANEKNQAKRLQAIGSAEHQDTVTDAIVEGLPEETGVDTEKTVILTSDSQPEQERIASPSDIPEESSWRSRRGKNPLRVKPR